MSRTILVSTALVSLLPLLAGGDAAKPKSDAKDWPSYNYDVLGTRHNAGERVLGKDNAAKLVEKWRFPATLSLTFAGAIHGTPVVVNGYVYFGTATFPTVYKLTPSGKRRWSFAPKSPGGSISSS